MAGSTLFFFCIYRFSSHTAKSICLIDRFDSSVTSMLQMFERLGAAGKYRITFLESIPI